MSCFALYRSAASSVAAQHGEGGAAVCAALWGHAGALLPAACSEAEAAAVQ